MEYTQVPEFGLSLKNHLPKDSKILALITQFHALELTRLPSHFMSNRSVVTQLPLVLGASPSLLRVTLQKVTLPFSSYWHPSIAMSYLFELINSSTKMHNLYLDLLATEPNYNPTHMNYSMPSEAYMSFPPAVANAFVQAGYETYHVRFVPVATYETLIAAAFVECKDLYRTMTMIHGVVAHHMDKFDLDGATHQCFDTTTWSSKHFGLSKYHACTPEPSEPFISIRWFIHFVRLSPLVVVAEPVPHFSTIGRDLVSCSRHWAMEDYHRYAMMIDVNVQLERHLAKPTKLKDLGCHSIRFYKMTCGYFDHIMYMQTKLICPELGPHKEIYVDGMTFRAFGNQRISKIKRIKYEHPEPYEDYNLTDDVMCLPKWFVDM